MNFILEGNLKQTVLYTYRVFHIKGPKIIAYSSKNKSLRDFQSLLGAHQMLSI